jgi:ketosteroid isomerase-like protein
MNRDWESAELCDRYLDAIERRDFDVIERCYAPECIAWHSGDERHRQRDDTIAVLKRVTKDLKKIEYADRISHFFEGGFVCEYTIKVVRENGFEGKMECCLVAHTRDGMLSRMYEYWCSNRIEEFTGPQSAGH